MGGHSSGGSFLFGEWKQLHRNKSREGRTGGILQAYNLGECDQEATSSSAFDAWKARGRQDFGMGPSE